ncbi:MAG: hypothetical protein OER86_08685 [Phycisphaerae bacterium]|nr:hypothetical protein [Phycisphaerae bacterium]
MPRYLLSVCLALTVALAPTAIWSAPDEPKAKTHRVAKGKIEVTVDLDAIVEAKRMWPIRVDTRQWLGNTRPLKIQEAVAPGTKVRQGQIILRFDTEAIDRTIADTRRAAAASGTRLAQAEQESKLVEKAHQMELAAAERTYARYTEDHQRYRSLLRARQIRDAANEVKNREQSLAYSREELKQLKRMYKEDNLTEETEEMILKRQVWSVQWAELGLLKAHEKQAYTLDIAIPRQDTDWEKGLETAELTIRRARDQVPLKLQAAREALAATRAAHEKTDRVLSELEADRKLFAVKSPADGLLYYGSCVRGAWQHAETVANTIGTRGTFKPQSVIATVVDPAAIHLRTAVAESDLGRIAVGSGGWAQFKSRPEPTVDVTVASIDPVALAPGKYGAVLTANAGEPGGTLPVPGMTAKVQLRPYHAENAVLLPARLVQRDHRHRAFVQLPSADGGRTKRTIRLGHRQNDVYEVLEGLSEGDTVLPPPAKASAAAAKSPPKTDKPKAESK